jgi:hypothetical protein
MWIPDRGIAEVASWRIAATLLRHHPTLRIGWDQGPAGVDRDAMIIEGAGRGGPFEIVIDRAGSILCEVEADPDDASVLRLDWDEVLRRDPGEDRVDLASTVARITQAARLVRKEEPDVARSAYVAECMAAVVAFHVGRGRRVSTSGEWFDRYDDPDHPSPAARTFPGLIDGMLNLVLDPGGPPAHVWYLTLDDAPDLALHLESGLTWVVGHEWVIDMHTVGELMGKGPLDSAAAAAWLVGPRYELPDVQVTDWPPSRSWPGSTRSTESPTSSPLPPAPAPQGQLGLGVVEPVDAPSDRFLIVDGWIFQDDDGDDGDPERGSWIALLTPLAAPEFAIRSHLRPIAAPGDDPRNGLRFHGDEGGETRAYTFRALRDEDAAWISRFDIDLTAHDVRLLINLLEALKEDLDLPERGPWTDLEQEWARAEQLCALVAEDGTIVFALHYLLLDGNAVMNPQFRQRRLWSDEFPIDNRTWKLEARRVLRDGITEPDPEHLGAGEDPVDEPFMMLGVADYIQIHPTMARAFMGLFDHDHPVPASIARLAVGHADDLIRLDDDSDPRPPKPEEPGPGSHATHTRPLETGPIRSIDLMHLLYDIEVAFARDR